MSRRTCEREGMAHLPQFVVSNRIKRILLASARYLGVLQGIAIANVCDVHPPMQGKKESRAILQVTPEERRQ